MINKYFLAKMNIPAYLKKFLYNRYYGYIIEGIPPITFQGNGKYLLDYKIDGAVGGVGDRTKNLFDYSTVTTGYRITWSTGMSVADNSAIMSDFIAVSNGIYRANVSVNLIGYDINKNYIGTYDPNNKIFRKDYGSKTTYYEIADNNVKFVKLLSFSATDTISQDTMFCNSTTILEYEPYGYKVPVVCGGITTNIYLDKPIYAKANIPSEYTEVEYIESTGTQYINTNYTPVQGDDLEFKNVTINTFNGALFSAGTESYQLILLGSGSLCYYKYFQAGNAVALSFSTITNGNIKVLNGNLYINNVLKVKADYGGAVNTTLNIFQRANNTNKLIGKIGEIIISNNGIIKRNFIPCYRKSDNVAGLYDLVNNVFYTNQGTGNFIVGPIKENESISLSDTNVNIPTIRGTNVLTVDTTVQPSNVYIKVGGG